MQSNNTKMTLFKLKKNKFKEKEITTVKSKQIYELLKTINASDIRKEEEFRMYNIKKVEKEIIRLENEIVSKMNGSFKDFVVTTQIALTNSLNSTMLDVSKVVIDVIKWSDGEPDISKTWTEYKASFLEA